MPDFLQVPWLQWKRFIVSGVVREAESGRAVPGLLVNAFDQDLVKDDYLGQCETDADGRFEIRFTDADFKDVVESRPDLYLCVIAPGSREPVHDTRYEVRENADREEFFEIEIPRTALGS